ncbi:MAG: sigma-70 family RNA polymerase sigma factor [Ruminococcus sp.]|nr:sigma-70 family RNA polymerase sigma factor [Ruminococcus sp.]
MADTKECTNDYSKYSDELLAIAARDDKYAAAKLISRYICSIEVRAKNLAPANYEDLAQEGLIGLLKAIDTYDESLNVKFSTFANVCIDNNMRTALKKKTNFDDAEVVKISEDDIHDLSEIPDDILVEKEKLRDTYQVIFSVLSEQEWQVFQLFLTGFAYNQIALELGVPLKTVDNAMQRVRRKLKSILRSGRE